MAWDQLVEQGRHSFADPDFDKRERDYKRGRRLAREAKPRASVRRVGYSRRID